MTQLKTEPSPEEIDAGYREFTGEVNMWHFAMMNDTVRNAAYEAALRSSVRNGGIVLDIGSGSGLLAMMAARHGASRVITCEEIPIIARKAADIIRLNGHADRIRVINKLSSELVVGQDLPERADVLVTEIFDDGLLGECAFSAIQHAQDHLLKPDARLIPASARVIAMCIESAEVFRNHRVGEVSGFDLSPFNEFTTGNYVGYHLAKTPHRPLSAPKTVFEFDFRKIPGPQSVPVEFEIVDSGLCHAIAYWFELQLDENTTITTAPHLPALSSWKQAVRILKEPLAFTRGERKKFTAHHGIETIWFTPGEQP